MEFFKIRFGNDLDEITYRFEKTVEDMLGSRGPSFMLERADLEVEISSKAVRIQGQRLAPACSPDHTYRLAEIQYGRFERILFLPSPIDPEQVTAASKNGFLEIRLTKRPVGQSVKVQISNE
jgi:HSP20 family protein